MYTLYASPGACSMAVHVILEEVGATYRLEKISLKDGQNRTEAFLKLNPRGQVPVLEEDGKVIREGGAQIIYLCDKFKSALLPQSGFERAAALEWLLFCNATLHPAYSRAIWLNAKAPNVPGRTDILNAAIEGINSLWKEVETHLQTRSFLCGDKISAADILLTVIANWSGNFPAIHIGTKTQQLFRHVTEMPSFKKVLQEEGVTHHFASAA